MKYLLKLNKKAEEDFASESILSIPRIVFLIFVLIILVSPIGCYSKNKQEQLAKARVYETSLLFIEAQKCLEKGISEKSFQECFKRENIGVKIDSGDNFFIFNLEKYEKELCKLSKEVKCLDEIVIIKQNNEIKQVNIDMVVNYG